MKRAAGKAHHRIVPMLAHMRGCQDLLNSMRVASQHRQIAGTSHSIVACRQPPPASRRTGQSLRPSRLLQQLVASKLGLLLLFMAGTAECVTPVPAGLTELDTAEGQQMLRNSTPSDRFWQLAQEFVTQDSQDWCGLASASMVLNALPIPKPALHAFQGWVSPSTRQSLRSQRVS